MATVRLPQIYDAIWSRLSALSNFKTKSQIWHDYTSDNAGHPALYLQFLTTQPMPSIDGYPTLYQLTCQISIRADKKAFPSTPGILALLNLTETVKAAFKPDDLMQPGSAICTLGFGRKWVDHAWISGVEYFYDLEAEDDLMSAELTLTVVCQAAVVA